MEKCYQGNEIWLCWLISAGSLKEKLQICIRGNQMGEDFEHVKYKCILPTSIT
jgi:hypothetical protein